MTVLVCVRVCIRDDHETATSANTQTVTDYKTLKYETQACSSMSHYRTQTLTLQIIKTRDYWQ